MNKLDTYILNFLVEKIKKDKKGTETKLNFTIKFIYIKIL